MSEQTKNFDVGYRYIPPSDAFIPLVYIPMQRMGLAVKAPFGKEQVVDAIIEFFPEGFFPAGRDYFHDVEFYEAWW